MSIPDANLRAAIEDALGKTRSATITDAEMKTLRELKVPRAEISDLTGLEFATNLEVLQLWTNKVADISPLRGLTNLTELQLQYNLIEDISALSGLTSLKVLVLRVNLIEDISALSGLTSLERLWLEGNPIEDISALSGLTNLKDLALVNNNISDISALAGLANLTELQLGGNNISDISALAGLANLTELQLGGNNIEDISALAGLANLEWLALTHNKIADISPLRGLTNLEELYLSYNKIADISPLRGLTNLEELDLWSNRIADISPLRGLTNLTELEIRWNPLKDSSLNDHIPALERRGVAVLFTRLRKSDFDIELVFLDSFTEDQKHLLRLVARRWASVITEDLPDYEFAQGWSGRCGDHSYTIPSGERIDDLRIYMTTSDDNPDAVGFGGPTLLREETHLPVIGCMQFDLEQADLLVTGQHEVGHVLGFGSGWKNFGFIRDLSGDPHFNGPLAIAAFNDAGGRDYTGKKVPVQKDGVHWRGDVFSLGELMLPWGGAALSAITVQSLADLGYGVDVTQADPYTLPGAAAKASAKIAALPSMLGYGMGISRADSYTLPGADPHWQGSIAGGLPSIFGDDHLIRRLAPHPHTEPQPLCSLVGEREPIYVVDPQGRIIRTLGH